MNADYGHPFIQAAKHTPGRSGAVLWIVLHSTDDHEDPDYAEDLGRYFAAGSGGRNVSSHFGTDSNSTMQYVRVADTAWCAMETANRHGVHIEMTGQSRQTRAQWLDDFGHGLIEQTGALIARIASDQDIPLRYLSDTQLRDRQRGIITHAQVTRVIGEGNTHTDPGDGFPLDVLLARATQLTGDDMFTADDRARLIAMDEVIRNGHRVEGNQTHTPADGPWAGKSQPLNPMLHGFWRIEEALKQLGAQLPDLDEADLVRLTEAARAGAEAGAAAGADEIAAAIVALLPDDEQLTRADVEAALAKVIGSVKITATAGG